MRKPSSMYAPVYAFQSSLSAGLIASGAPSVAGCIVTTPSSAFRRSSIRRNNVVLPAPLLPTRPRMSPLLIVKLLMSTAVFMPKCFSRLQSSIFIYF